MISVEAIHNRVVVKGKEVEDVLAASLREWFPRSRMAISEGQVSFQSASPRLASFKKEVVRHALHLKGLMRADDTFETKALAQNLWGCRP